MSDLVNFYEQEALAQVSSIPWLKSLQKKALLDFMRLGFPRRTQEDWKYTAVDSFLKTQFASQSLGQHNNATTKSPGPAVPIGLPIDCINGVVRGIEAITAHLPKGAIVLPMAEALVLHPETIKPYLSQILQQQHGFQALNTAMLHAGLFIYLPEGVCMPLPLRIAHVQDNANQATYIRHLVILDKGSSLTLIEDYLGAPDISYVTNTITEAYLAADATMTHYKIQRESKLAYHVGHLAVKQATSSQFNSHSFSLGGKVVRSDITIGLEGVHAGCLMNGIYAPTEGQHMDHHTVVTHAVPDCQSAQDYKGILCGQSRAVFNGQVIVAKHAQHTSAKQQNKNLLLSAQAEVDTKPQLDIFADDVVCTHGATVGQLDEEALFYLATRGINRADASRYLVQAFATENLKAFSNVDLAEWLGTLLNEQLG